MKPTQEEVNQEIQKLKDMKPKVRHRTLFGDDNHAAIEAGIRVLEDRLSNEAIFDFYEDEEYECDAALDAWAWIEGNEATSPSESWSVLVQ